MILYVCYNKYRRKDIIIFRKINSKLRLTYVYLKSLKWKHKFGSIRKLLSDYIRPKILYEQHGLH